MCISIALLAAHYTKLLPSQSVSKIDHRHHFLPLQKISLRLIVECQLD